jgi:cysteinyl-tRNA synthetase
MELALYDTLTRQKRVFTPLDPAHVRMYACGPTVYDFAHIGNARPVIVFDVLFRLLRYLAKQGVWDGGKGETKVTYVRNITDVDDKINARAAEEYPDLPLNEAIRRVTEKTDKQFHEDVAALGCLPPTIEPRATEHIEPMKALIERLVAQDCAYVAAEHVLFRVSSMPDYGQLSKRSLDEMIAGARVEVAPYKDDPMDFVLWKPSKPGEPAWPSPCGIATPGRPGWHIECSAMADRWLWTEARPYLSERGLAHPHQFDIHGGGVDLVFPHHENEIAQTRCAFHTPVMANFWMHNGFLQVEGRKMAKSEGNFITIRELLKSWTGPVVRFAMLQTPYRQPINWTTQRLEQARHEMDNWTGFFRGSEAEHDYHMRKFASMPPQPSEELLEALGDDLNTPNAIAVLRRQFSDSAFGGLTTEFFQSCEFLGILDADKIGALEGTSVSGSGSETVRGDLLFEAIPHVMNLRVGFANSIPEIVGRETDKLREMGIEPIIAKYGFVDLQPLSEADALDKKKIDRLISRREAARNAKKFAEADGIRDELKSMGIELEDHKDGTTTWKVKR